METYIVKITNEATLDLIQIYNYISIDLQAPETASKQVDRIRSAIRSLDVFPLRNKIVSFEPWQSKQYRQITIDNFIAYYSVDKTLKVVTILRIFYGKRDIENLIK